MRTRLTTAILAITVATTLLPCVEARAQTESDELRPASVEFSRTIHFAAPDGTAVALASGVYRVEAEGETLRLFPLDGDATDVPLIGATAIEHEEDISWPVAVGFPGENEDRHHVLFLLPGGKALEAVGSYGGVQTRGTRQLATIDRRIRYTRPVAVAIAKQQVYRIVATANSSNQQFVGTWWAGGANPDHILEDDFITGLRVDYINMVEGANQLSGVRRFYIDSTEEELLGHITIYLRGDRSGSRNHKVEVGYKPRQGFNGNGGAGTLMLKRFQVGTDGVSRLTTLASATYATPPCCVAGPEAILSSPAFSITETEGIGDTSPYLVFYIYGTPTNNHMGGEFTFVSLKTPE